MFRILLSKDLKENISNYRFIIALISCVTVIPLSFYVNGKDYKAKEQNYEESIRLYDEYHEKVGDVEQLGGSVFRPPSSLSIISSGLEYLLPNSVETVGNFTHEGVQTRLKNDQSLDTPYLFLYGRIDLTFIVTIIMSLLALLFAYNCITGEKENGTLGQVLSNSVPRNIVVLAKITAIVTILSIVFLLGISIGLLILLFMGFDVLNNSHLVFRFILATGISLLYIIIFSLLGLLVSTLKKTSVSAIVTLMFCWVFLFMIFPKGSVIFSKIIRPVKSQQVIDLEKNQIRIQFQKAENEEMQSLRKTMPGIQDMSTREFFDKWQQGDKYAKDYDAKQKELQESYRIKCENELLRYDSYYAGQQSSQAVLARNISRLSPVSCFVHIMAEISNAGLLEYEQWRRTQDRFKYLLDNEISRKMTSVSFGNLSVARSQTLDADAPMPKIQFESVSLEEVFSKTWPDFILLILYGCLLFAGAYVSFLKYDVR